MIVPYIWFINYVIGNAKEILSNEYFYIDKPVKPVSVVLPMYREPCSISTKCLDSLDNQHLRKYFQLVCVLTQPTCMENVYEVCDEVIITDRKGKLYARHIGIEKSSGEIIVSVDGDTIYPDYFIDMITYPFIDKDIVGVQAYTDDPFIDLFIFGLKKQYYGKLLTGRNSAFLRKSYYEIGGFDLELDKKLSELRDKGIDTSWILAEYEEKTFREMLSKIGRVIDIFIPGIKHLGERYGRGLHP